jgi:hypothetical protein
MKRAKSTFRIAVAVVLVGTGCSHSKFPDRHEFARLLSSVHQGMTDQQVMRILGKPDDIRSGKERTGVNDSTEDWCFGTDGHLSFATLGTIYLRGENGRKVVVAVDGGKGIPPPRSLFTEEELRKHRLMLDHRTHQRGLWDPAWAIQVVNTLQPLGKHKALAALEEYERVLPSPPLDRPDLSMILRILFDVPEDPGYMPKIAYAFIPRDPKDPRIPRYPILMLGDVPLQVGFGIDSTGIPPRTFAEQAAFFRDHTTLRAKPLQPTDKPLQLYSEWKAYEWLYRDRDALSHLTWPTADEIPDEIKAQIQRLVTTVYRGDVEKGSLPRPVRWDVKRNMYTFLDGTTLSDMGKELMSALDRYAHDHGGAYPAGEPTPEASLSLFYPKYANAWVVSGNTAALASAKQTLERGKRLSPDTCGWHYVEGLTLNDDPKLALCWDKIGLAHNGVPLFDGGREVLFVPKGIRYISDAEWPKFLEEQEKLLAKRMKGKQK